MSIGPVRPGTAGSPQGRVCGRMAAAQLAEKTSSSSSNHPRSTQQGQLGRAVPGPGRLDRRRIAPGSPGEHWRGAEAGLGQGHRAADAGPASSRAADPRLAEAGDVSTSTQPTGGLRQRERRDCLLSDYPGTRPSLLMQPLSRDRDSARRPTCSQSDQEPRSSVVALLGRALAALPQAVPGDSAGHVPAGGLLARGRRVLRRDLARAAAAADMAFAIGAERITSIEALAGISEDAWRYRPAWKTRRSPSPRTSRGLARTPLLLIRPGRTGPHQVFRPIPVPAPPHTHPDSGAADAGLEQDPPCTPTASYLTRPRHVHPAQARRRRALVRHRTSAEHLPRQQHGAALRHLPSGHEQITPRDVLADRRRGRRLAPLRADSTASARRRRAEGDDRRLGILVVPPGWSARRQLIMRLGRSTPAAASSRDPRAPARLSGSPTPGPATPPPAHRSPETGRPSPGPQKGPNPNPALSACAPTTCNKIIYMAVDTPLPPTRGFGSEVSRWLGHKSITTTVDLYGHLVPEAAERARDALDKAFQRATAHVPGTARTTCGRCYAAGQRYLGRGASL